MSFGMILAFAKLKFSGSFGASLYVLDQKIVV